MAYDNLKLKVDDYLPLRDVVFNTLRQAILTGEFLPGERLMEVTLADRLGVSRPPVREAIRKLELEGLVIMVPRRGAQVASITVSGVLSSCEASDMKRRCCAQTASTGRSAQLAKNRHIKYSTISAAAPTASDVNSWPLIAATRLLSLTKAI